MSLISGNWVYLRQSRMVYNWLNWGSSHTPASAWSGAWRRGSCGRAGTWRAQCRDALAGLPRPWTPCRTPDKRTSFLGKPSPSPSQTVQVCSLIREEISTASFQKSSFCLFCCDCDPLRKMEKEIFKISQPRMQLLSRAKIINVCLKCCGSWAANMCFQPMQSLICQ